jgi:hypothetical protein
VILLVEARRSLCMAVRSATIGNIFQGEILVLDKKIFMGGGGGPYVTTTTLNFCTLSTTYPVVYC